jgi:hypothetical protein
MNASSRSRNYAQTSARSTEGGSKKAGLVPTATSTATRIAYSVRALPQLASVMQTTLFPNVKASRPISMRSTISMR